MRARQEMPLAGVRRGGDDRCIEPLISHRDATTIMRLLADIQQDVRDIRLLQEDDDGEAEVPEDDS